MQGKLSILLYSRLKRKFIRLNLSLFNFCDRYVPLNSHKAVITKIKFLEKLKYVQLIRLEQFNTAYFENLKNVNSNEIKMTLNSFSENYLSSAFKN